MASNFPTSVDNFIDRQDGIDIIQAADINDAYAAAEAVETFIGASGKNQSNNIDILQFLKGIQDPDTKIHATWISATTVRLSIGVLLCNKQDDTLRALRRLTSTVDITFANLDTGAEAANTRYYILAVADASATTVTGALSLSDTAPTGITTFWVVGSIYNNAASDLEEESLINYDDAAFPKGHLYGGVMANHATANWLTIGQTIARDDTDAVNIKAPALNKNIGSAWAAGTGNGFIDTGSVATGLYHIFLIWGPTKHGDYIASTSTSPTMPTGYTYKRYLGSRYYSGSDWVDFVTTGNGLQKYTELYAPIAVVSGGSATSMTDVDISAYVRDGYAQRATFAFFMSQSTVAQVTLYARMNGSSTAIGNLTRIGSDHDDQSGPGNPSASITWEQMLDSNGIFEYATSGGSGDINLRGFMESL